MCSSSLALTGQLKMQLVFALCRRYDHSKHRTMRRAQEEQRFEGREQRFEGERRREEQRFEGERRREDREERRFEEGEERRFERERPKP